MNTEGRALHIIDRGLCACLMSLTECITDTEIKCSGDLCIYIVCSFHNGACILVGKPKLSLNFNCLPLPITR